MEPSTGVADSIPDGITATARRVDRTLARRLLRSADPPFVAWTAPDGRTIAGIGATARITATGGERFETIRRRASTLLANASFDAVPPPARPRVVGGFSFHAEHTAGNPWDGFPSAQFLLPKTQVVTTDEGAWLTRTARTEHGDPSVESVTGDDRPSPEPAAPPGIDALTWHPDRPEWCAGVESALDRIAAGTLTKVVLAGSLRADLVRPADPVAVLTRLDRAYPSCHRFLVHPVDGPAFVGATPERLVSLSGRSVETEVLAGSTGRGDTTSEDDWLASELRDSAKDGHEHAVAVDAIRRQLDPVSTSVSTGDRTVRRLATVQHLHTPVRAQLDADRHVLDLVAALHPTPAVGGLPPDAALEAIRDVEPFDRGWYAGPVGWFDPAGDGTFAIGIRSALLDDRTATLFAGAGIVADSDPDREWDEVQLKYRPILDALDD